MAENIKLGEDINLVPDSGIQFLDFDLSLGGKKSVNVMFLSSENDDIILLEEDTEGELSYVDGRNKKHAVKTENFSVPLKDVVKMFSREWVPLPYFRSKKAAAPQNGPINWVRARFVETATVAEQDARENEFKLTLAADTSLMPRTDGRDYLAPSEDDVENGDEFSFISFQPHLLDFLDMEWVYDWMFEMFKDRLFRAPRGASYTDDNVLEYMINTFETPRYHMACYLAFLHILKQRLDDISLKLVRSDPAFNVDLVLDLGNSRTCGLVIETVPDKQSADLNRAEALKIRDLSCPELRSNGEPFDSRIEFNTAHFGKNNLSMKSGRADAFEWHSMVRIGDEASRLSGQIDSRISNSGMSSPKRYLWDEDRREQDWVFNNTAPDGTARLNHGSAAKNTRFSLMVTSGGEPLSSFEPDDPTAVFAAEARYSRSSLMAFAIAEIIMQVLCMINSWEYRKHKGNASQPRRLRSLVMTIPSAMIAQERDILKNRARAAIDLVWACQGMDARGIERPKLEVDLDESSATQLVYLYSEFAETFSGNARSFIKLTKRPFIDDQRPDVLRVASIDIGGGTTDLVITDYSVKGSGGTGVIEPNQIFREGFNIAGDDVLRGIVEQHVLSVIMEAAIDCKVDPQVAESIMVRLFGGDSSGKGAEKQKLRHLFINIIAIPIALKILSQYEKYDPLETSSVDLVRFRDVFPAEIEAEGGEGSVVRVRRFLEEAIIESGGVDFVLSELNFPVDVKRIWATVNSVMGASVDAICEVLDTYACDVLLLSGRPSRLPYFIEKIQNSHALPPDRIIPLSNYSVGAWYPFRDTKSRITDPKTTAAMGASIGAVSRGNPKNFSFRSELLEYASTMCFIGMIADGRIREENIFYSNVDLNEEDYQFEGDGGEFSGKMDIGFRQLPLDWWPATKIYEIDYEYESVEKLRKWVPLQVTFKRENFKSGSINERFKIDMVTHDSDEAPGFSPRNLTFKLKTLREDDGYWLDTGIVFNK